MSREVDRISDDIHVFTVKGQGLLYDGGTGCLCKLDSLGLELLTRFLQADPATRQSYLEKTDPPASILGDRLSDFPLQEVRRAWQELRCLYGSWIGGPDRDLPADTLQEAQTFPQTPVKALCLDVAHDCNLVCRYCFASCGSFGGKRQLMTRETARAAIDFLIGASGNRWFLDVDFFGGEPLLAFDVVQDAVSYARARSAQLGKQFRFTLTTNCTLLNDRILQWLNENEISLILSLDGRPEVHDSARVFRDGRPSHSVVLREARKAVESRRGKNYYIRGTYTRYNLDFYRDVKYLYDCGFRRISMEPAVGDGTEDWSIQLSDLQALRASYEELADFILRCRESGDPLEFFHFDLGLEKGVCRERRITGCGAGYEYLAVTPSGELYPCHQLVGQPQFQMGNVFEGILKPEISETFQRAKVPDKPSCRKCWARYLCGGGCHARALSASGSISIPCELTCLIMKTRLEVALFVQAVSH